MIVHCSKCGINWAALHTQADEVGEECYEFCPVCKTDAFIEPGTDITAYILCPFTGKITDVDTGDELILPAEKFIATQKPYDHYANSEERERRKLEREARENAAIGAYQQAYNSDGPVAAAQIFFDTINK